MNFSAHRPRAAIFVVACLAAVLGLSATASARPTFGIQGMWPDESPTTLNHQLDVAQRVGAKQVRIGVQWRQLQPTGPDAYDATYLAAVDRTMAAASARHLKVVLFVTQTPCWASTAPASAKAACTATTTPYEVYRYPPADPATFAKMSSFLVARYQAGLAAYEVWNEPDQSNENYWAGPDKVARYVAMVKAAYGPLKQAAPKVPVLAGSFVGGNGKWLQAMYHAGIKGYYDGLAVHFYDLPLYALKVTRQTQKANGDSKPEWLTEFGWNSCYRKGGPATREQHRCITPAVQASALNDLAKAVRNTSWLKSAILYQVDDENADYRFGLFDTAGKRKPSYNVFDHLMHGGLTGGLPRPTVRLRVRGGQLVASGRASIDDVFKLTASVGGQLRYRANLRSDRSGLWTVKFPKSIGTSGVKVHIASFWSSSVASSASR
ncbi:MAG TPA: cellulase family glycosylhydrolase [Baekduia sp.]